MPAGIVSLVEGILFQGLLTWIIECYQHLQVFFAHVHLQSNNLLLERSIHQEINRGRPMVAWDKTFPEVARKIVVGSLRLGLHNAAD